MPVLASVVMLPPPGASIELAPEGKERSVPAAFAGNRVIRSGERRHRQPERPGSAGPSRTAAAAVRSTQDNHAYVPIDLN